MKLMLYKEILLLALICSFISCTKDDNLLYLNNDKIIKVSSDISIDNTIRTANPIFNFITYDAFLRSISGSDHFLIVPLRDFEKTNSTTKVVLSLRYDIDFHIKPAIQMAYLERKYKICSSFYILHTADYYGRFINDGFVRNKDLIKYLKFIQDSCGQEIGFHNDLLTLQIVYDISPREYLKNELNYLRSNSINITGTTYHGSQFCYIYKYYNAYFWKEYSNGGWNYEYVVKGLHPILFEKDSLKSYNFQYEGGLLQPDYFFTDVSYVNGKRWHMGMVNLDTIKSGKKVIILLHPNQWE